MFLDQMHRQLTELISSRMGWDFNMGFQAYGPEYKKSRKLFHYGFQPRASDAYQPIQTVLRLLCFSDARSNCVLERNYVTSSEATSKPGTV